MRTGRLILATLIFLGSPFHARAGGGTIVLTDPLGVVTPTLDCKAAPPCGIRVRADVGGQMLLSPLLPFSAFGNEPTFHVNDGVWSVGLEPNATQVTFETIETGTGPAILVQQTVGYDHVKRAYLLLVPTSDGLQIVKSWSEGTGPGSITVQPLADGVLIHRSFNNGPVKSEAYQWSDDGLDLLKAE